MKAAVGLVAVIVFVAIIVGVFRGDDGGSSTSTPPAHAADWHTVPIKGWACDAHTIAEIERTTGGVGYCVD
ncbi:hypothetical protein ACVBEQ_21755 [Nakamurella sp. GG22]